MSRVWTLGKAELKTDKPQKGAIYRGELLEIETDYFGALPVVKATIRVEEAEIPIQEELQIWRDELVEQIGGC